jgi:hypothetical protein
MDKNISQSNANLRQAASQNIDTSPRVEQATADAANVSSSKLKDNSSVGSDSQDFNKSVNNFKRSTKSRPSYEGYMNSSSAHIQVTGTGYDNKRNQQARDRKNLETKKPPKMELAKQSSPFGGNFQQKNAIINNYTKNSMTKNSKTTIDNMVKINNLTF